MTVLLEIVVAVGAIFLLWRLGAFVRDAYRSERENERKIYRDDEE